jgi:hypothetical protein
MHIITKAMKLFSLSLITLLLVNVLLHAQVPTTWVLGTQYDSGSFVGYEDKFYKAIQDVPGSVGGTPDTLTDYWVDIFSTKPNGNPGDPPDFDQNISDSDFSNLTPPPEDYIKGDFNSDGIPDIVWQKPGTNETKFWFMNTDGTKKSEMDLSHTAGVVWRFSSMADMNKDGKEDMLWQKEDGSTVFCYYMDGSGGISSGVSLASGVATGWKFASASDYNGDGNADFLWHNTTKGSTVSWHFDGNGVVNGFSPLGSGISDIFNSYGGQDMNADGNSDVIYQNSNNGRVLAWYFDDKKNILGTKKYFTSLDTSLKVVGVKDYDKDGAVDILLQHSTTGVAKIVYFDTAGTELSEKEIGTVDTTTLWHIRN